MKNTFWQELQRRKVVRAAIAYMVFSWVLVQVVVTVAEPLNLPDWTDTFVIALLAIGFPVTMLLSWAFDLTPTATDSNEPAPVIKSVVLTASMLLLVALLVGTHRVATGIWIFENPDRPPELQALQLISTFPGSHTEPAFSPDGSMMAFVSDVTGLPQIWVANLAGGTPVQVTSGEQPSHAPVWSPDASQIYFHRPGEGIFSIAPLGASEPRPIIEHGYNPSFSSDGKQIVFDHGRDIGIANADGTEQRTIEGAPERFFVTVRMHPSMSPDGRWVAVFAANLGPTGDYWLLPAEGGDAVRLTFDQTQGGPPAWSPDSKHVIFQSRREGTQTIWAVPVAGGDPVPITTGVGEDSDPTLSADGGRILFSNSRVEYSVMLTDPDTGLGRPVYVSRYSSQLPQISPDGSSITFFAEVPNGAHVFTIDTDGNNLRQVTTGEGEINIHPRFSADGNSVLYYRIAPDMGLRRVSVDGWADEEIFPGYSWQTHMGAVEDPQGRNIAITRMEPPDWSKDRNLIVNLETGEETLIAESDVHFHGQEWFADGASVTGNRHNGEMVECSLDGDCTVLLDADSAEPLLGSIPQWSVDGSRIFFRRPGEDPTYPELWAANADGSEARLAFTYGPTQDLDRVFDLTPDNKILWKMYERGKNEIWMAELVWD